MFGYNKLVYETLVNSGVGGLGARGDTLFPVFCLKYLLIAELTQIIYKKNLMMLTDLKYIFRDVGRSDWHWTSYRTNRPYAIVPINSNNNNKVDPKFDLNLDSKVHDMLDNKTDKWTLDSPAAIVDVFAAKYARLDKFDFANGLAKRDEDKYKTGKIFAVLNLSSDKSQITDSALESVDRLVMEYVFYLVGCFQMYFEMFYDYLHCTPQMLPGKVCGQFSQCHLFSGCQGSQNGMRFHLFCQDDK